jgi:hypothetical protein
LPLLSHPPGRFLSSNCALSNLGYTHEKSILGKFTPGDNILKTVNLNLYFQMEAKQGGFFQTAVAGTNPRTER